MGDAEDDVAGRRRQDEDVLDIRALAPAMVAGSCALNDRRIAEVAESLDDAIANHAVRRGLDRVRNPLSQQRFELVKRLGGREAAGSVIRWRPVQAIVNQHDHQEDDDGQCNPAFEVP
jgi:hypothetical protein